MPTYPAIAPHGDVATWSSGIAAGAGLHLPVGTYGGATYRSAMRFSAPSVWQDWTAITKATLTFYISDFDHVAPKNSSIYCRRQTNGAGLWDTLAEGTQNCESGFAGSNTSQYTDIQGVTADQIIFSSGTTANAKKTLTVTAMVQYYWSQNVARMPFVFERVASDDYTEIWSRNKSGYNAELVIEYEDNTVPDAPTLTAPTHTATVVDDTPLLDWTHNDPQGDPQASAQVRVWDAAGTTQVGSTQTVTGTATSLAWPNTLARGTTYQWDVRTADVLGYGAYATKKTFTVKALPTVTIASTRVMVMSSGLPTLKVSWTVAGGTQSRYRVEATAIGYDSTWKSGTATNWTMTGATLTSGTAVSVKVTVETTDFASGMPAVSATRSFTPRWGLTTMRMDMGATPVNWGTPTVISTVPTGCTLTVEYGSAATVITAPTGGWFSSLGAVTKRRYAMYRVWFVPSATEAPTLNSIAIPADFATEVADHWYGNPSTKTPIPAPWSVDTGEYVYGTRSMTAVSTGAQSVIYSAPIKVRDGRSYILTGLMKAEGAAYCTFSLFDADTLTILKTDEEPTPRDIISETLNSTRPWFEAGQLDVYRYRTPIWKATGDIDVVVRLRIGATAGAQAWFDALKLEESTVATPWGPSAIGAVSLDAGGVQVDGTKGGVFRLRTSSTQKTIELGTNGIDMDGTLKVINNEIRILGTGSTALATDPDPTRTGLFQFRIAQANGELAWGAGGGATRDVNLYRGGIDQLYTDDAFHAALWLNTGGGFRTGGRTEWVPGRVEGFIYENIPASLVLTGMSRYVQANSALFIRNPLAGRNGRAIGIAWRCSATPSGGQVTLHGARGGTSQAGASGIINAAAGTTGYIAFGTPFTFTPTHSLNINIESTAAWLPVTADIAADLVVEWEAPTS